MKTREGFVSNSSSTSFLIYGICIQREELCNIDTVKKMRKVQPEWYDNLVDCYTDSWRDKSGETAKLLKNIDSLDEEQTSELNGRLADDPYAFEDCVDGMGIHWPCDDYELYVGSCPTIMKDNETMGEFKAGVEKILKRIFGDNIVCDFHEEAWRDG